jgi:carbamoyltransferase
MSAEWIVGLNHGAHDASAALLHHGQLVATIEQERLSRRKHALDEAPVDALAWCLARAGIELGDVDVVALGSQHDRLAQWLGLSAAERTQVLPYDDPERLMPASVFAGRPATIRAYNHHLSHAASAAYPSDHSDAAVLVMDAMGEDVSTTISHLSKGVITTLESFDIDRSLGFFFEAASEWAALGRRNAGKLMGLAPYGIPNQDVQLHWDSDGPSWGQAGGPQTRAVGRERIEARTAAAMEWFSQHCFPYEAGLVDEPMAYANFAASVQAAFERVVDELAARAANMTGSSTLTIAGGVALNCTSNGRLARRAVFENVWVQPMSHDAGVAFGAALLAAQEEGEDVSAPMRHAYWGPSAAEEDVLAQCRAMDLTAERLDRDKLVDRVARTIADGGVVVWHQGRGEVGPRALGARSFLADPRRRVSLVRLNKLKGREVWRPLAPSVPVEAFDTYFEGVPNPFMIMAAMVRDDRRSAIPAVVHIDGSARPQVVTREANEVYYELLQRFGEVAGVPILINTSLNLAGEPMCSSAADTLSTLVRSGADLGVIDDVLIRVP